MPSTFTPELRQPKPRPASERAPAGERWRGWRTDWLCRALAWGSRTMRIDRGSVLVFAPHQDDETFGCGGLIAQKRRAGAHVKVVFLTDGARSHDGPSAPVVGNLPELRQREALKALQLLGVPAGEVKFLDFPDGELARLPAEQRGVLVAQLADWIETQQPAEVFAPHRDDTNPDHEAAYLLITEALRLTTATPRVFEYSIWLLWNRNVPLVNLALAQISGVWKLPIHEVAAQKREAILAYRSQIDILPAPFLKRFRAPYELFFKSKLQPS